MNREGSGRQPMPPPESSQPDFDEVRRKADEFARQAYPDVLPGLNASVVVSMSTSPSSLPSLNGSITARKKFSSRLAGNLSVIRSIRVPSKFRLVGFTSTK